MRAIRFSRNFGKEAALLAGLEKAKGHAVITIDADLQYPPSLIPTMIAVWKRGAKVVHGVKRGRGNDGPPKFSIRRLHPDPARQFAY